MANENVAYVPGRTLGRSGHVPINADKFYEKIEHLDALLCVLSDAPEEAESTGFWSLNQSIQFAVMRLASALATEIHELNEERIIAEGNASMNKPAPWHKATPTQ